MKDRINRVFRDVFDDDSLQVRVEMSAKDLPSWDSLNHIKLVLALEREFDIRFTAQEIMNLNSVGDIEQMLQVKGIT